MISFMVEALLVVAHYTHTHTYTHTSTDNPGKICKYVKAKQGTSYTHGFLREDAEWQLKRSPWELSSLGHANLTIFVPSPAHPTSQQWTSNLESDVSIWCFKPGVWCHCHESYTIYCCKRKAHRRGWGKGWLRVNQTGRDFFPCGNKRRTNASAVTMSPEFLAP